MAKVYRAPIEGPPYRHASWREDEARYIDELRAMAREDSKGALVGKVVSFQVADGYARYMVWRQSPLSLVHLDLMDGYRIPEAHARGLNLADIKALVARDDALAALFADKEK
jgi:hypothetical protein